MAHQEGSELDRELVEGVPDDEEIEIGIKDALAWDGRLDASGVRVGVCAGAVILSGYVKSDVERELAGAIAAGYPGVTELANEIKVTGGEPC